MKLLQTVFTGDFTFILRFPLFIVLIIVLEALTTQTNRVPPGNGHEKEFTRIVVLNHYTAP